MYQGRVLINVFCFHSRKKSPATAAYPIIEIRTPCDAAAPFLVAVAEAALPVWVSLPFPDPPVSLGLLVPVPAAFLVLYGAGVIVVV